MIHGSHYQMGISVICCNADYYLGMQCRRYPVKDNLSVSTGLYFFFLTRVLNMLLIKFAKFFFRTVLNMLFTKFAKLFQDRTKYVIS